MRVTLTAPPFAALLCPAQVLLEGEATPEGAALPEDSGVPGTLLEVLVGHEAEMAAAGHKPHLLAVLGNSANKPDASDATC